MTMRFSIESFSPSKKEAVIGILEPGQFFGKGCLNGHPLRIATKGAKSFSECFSKALNEKVTINENGSRRTIPKHEAIMKQVVNKAASGDIKHIKLALEHMGALDERERVTISEATHREGTPLKSVLTVN
jgi:hypothetical protein